MVMLTESGLNRRHREFNRKVTEAAKKNVNFDDVKAETCNKSDIDHLFKIDIASKYKNIDYILEVLKSGDSLYITRVLTCTWLFDPEYRHIINPQFINDELFPHLPLKSKKELLKTISVNLREEHRAFEFYKFCNSLKYFDIAFKFLLFTNEETKIKLLREKSSEDSCLLDNRDWIYIRHFIGHSFTLAQTYLEIANESLQGKVLYDLRYLYSHSDLKYLDLLESYENFYRQQWCYDFRKFGFRISKDIIHKHRDRIYKKPELYTQIIKESIFVKYSTVEDAKYYLTALLPCNANAFWYQNYYESKKYFFDMIPKEERYQFMKNIFNDKYPGTQFEMTVEFYNSRFYDLMVDLELKEEWALRHVESEKEILGSGKDYLWYRFVKFNKSFDEIKKYIRINKDADVRTEIINVLIESARNDRELETLFKYYYERHINEERSQKERFFDAVDNHHNILNFDSNCFSALDKILYSLEVYNILTRYYCKPEYKIIGLIYRIINNIEMPEALVKFMDAVPFNILRSYTSKLATEKVPFVFDYIMEFYLKKTKTFEDQHYDESLKKSVAKYIIFTLDLMHQFEMPKKEIPEITMKYINLDWEMFKNHFYFQMPEVKRITQNDLLCCLKRDTSEFVSKLPTLKQMLTTCPFKLNRVLRKLRLYFSNDVAKEYLKLYEEILNESNVDKITVDLVVFGIIHLGDTNYLEEFMNKHIPTDTKIDHVAIDRKLLSVQSAICSFAGYARPPIPLSIMLKYLKGDYTQYCLPLINMYPANLQPTAFTNFVNAIVDSPLSVQKHGLRLAFQCFSNNDLKKLVSDMWRQTKNVSLRFIIYKALHTRIIETDDEDVASSFFAILNRFTSTVYEEDDPELFYLLTSDTLPMTLLNEHLKTVWIQFEKLPFRTIFIEYRFNAVKSLERNFSLIEPKDFIKKIVHKHVHYTLNHNQDEERYKMLKEGRVIVCKWYRTAKYITFLENMENLETKLNFTKLIASKCIKNWNKVFNGSNVYRNLFTQFLDLLKSQSYSHVLASYKYVNILFEYILKHLEKRLPVKEIYLLTWDLKLNIRTRNIIIDAKERRSAEVAIDVRLIFAKECAALVAEYMEINMFCIVFANDIQNIILSELQNIVYHLNDTYYMKSSDIIVQICNELIEMKVFDSYLLALKLLENVYNTYAGNTEHVESMLQNLGDPQITCFIYQKLQNNRKGNDNDWFFVRDCGNWDEEEVGVWR